MQRSQFCAWLDLHREAAAWRGNFRDLNAAVARMATLAPGGRISVEVVEEEIGRLQSSWAGPAPTDADALAGILSKEELAELDPFDRVQLQHVVKVCARSRSLSEAGRLLFSASRARKATTNDADRLRKYLQRFGLEWNNLRPV